MSDIHTILRQMERKNELHIYIILVTFEKLRKYCVKKCFSNFIKQKKNYVKII